MSSIEKAREFRNAKGTTYNCVQSVIIPFAQEMGLSEDQVCVLGSPFGAGMRHGVTDCPTLLRTSHERGEARKVHCDGLVCEMVETLSALVKDKK